MTVWRSLTFSGLWEMQQVSHISSEATETKIQPYFTDAFVKNHLPNAVRKLRAESSVKYIGLWQPEAPYQQNWNAIQLPRPNVNHTLLYGPTDADIGTVIDSEISPPAELLTATGFLLQPPDPVAQAQVRRRAQAWMERILSTADACMQAWRLQVPPYIVGGNSVLPSQDGPNRQ